MLLRRPNREIKEKGLVSFSECSLSVSYQVFIALCVCVCVFVLISFFSEGIGACQCDR